MTIEEINAKIKAVEGIKADYERRRDKSLERRMKGDEGSASDYLFWVGNIETAERELKRLHTDRAEIVLHGDKK